MAEYVLDLDKMLPLMRQAFVDKRIAAQNGEISCSYRYGDSNVCCIVGAGMDDVTAETFDKYGVLEDVDTRLDVKYVGENCRRVLRDLQSAHDGACTPDEDLRPIRMASFVAHFNNVLRDHGLEPVHHEG